MIIRCYGDCRFITINEHGTSDPDCMKENELTPDDGIELVVNANTVGKHDRTYRKCPLYKRFTRKELKMFAADSGEGANHENH